MQIFFLCTFNRKSFNNFTIIDDKLNYIIIALFCLFHFRFQLSTCLNSWDFFIEFKNRISIHLFFFYFIIFLFFLVCSHNALQVWFFRISQFINDPVIEKKYVSLRSYSSDTDLTFYVLKTLIIYVLFTIKIYKHSLPFLL